MLILCWARAPHKCWCLILFCHWYHTPWCRDAALLSPLSPLPDHAMPAMSAAFAAFFLLLLSCCCFRCHAAADIIDGLHTHPPFILLFFLLLAFLLLSFSSFFDMMSVMPWWQILLRLFCSFIFRLHYGAMPSHLSITPCCLLLSVIFIDNYRPLYLPLLSRCRHARWFGFIITATLSRLFITYLRRLLLFRHAAAAMPT